MDRRNIVASISVIELLLGLLIGILGNKIAELIQIEPIILVVVTIAIVVLLAGITFYRSRQAATTEKTTNRPSRPRIRATQRNVRKLTMWIGYELSAILLSGGGLYLARTLDKSWLGWLPAISVTLTLLLYPAFREIAVENGYKTRPIHIAWIFAWIYASAGMFALFVPNLFQSSLFLFAVITSVTMTGMQFAYMYYFLETVVDPWYRKLPER